MLFNGAALLWSTMLLGAEAHSVVGLRLRKIALGGPSALAEAQYMFAEKTTAMSEAALMLITGGSVQTVVSRLRSYVRANEARLLAFQ
jgi:hypothetical protein